MLYELKLMDTVAGVGCFSAMPGPNLSLNQVLDHLRAAPFDDFMHHFALQQLGKLRTRKVEQYIEAACAAPDKDPALAALLYEACLSHFRFAHLRERMDGLDLAMLARNSPSVTIRSHLLKDQKLHREWAKRFAAESMDHTPLPKPDQAGMPLPYSEEELRPARKSVGASEVRAALVDRLPPAKARKPALETALDALEKLDRAGAFATPEMQHKACLSPFARLRHWMFKLSVRNGRNEYTFNGMQTSYGRGFDADSTRASYSMEVAERFSSYASIGRKSIGGISGPADLFQGTLDQARAAGHALDLTALRTEVPYQGQSLCWMPGECATPQGPTATRIPVQLVYLFCNLDEQNLFSALGSTGLASGNTVSEARVAALCEVVERDADAVQPLDMRDCFRIETDDPKVRKHLDALAECGIHVWFQDMTSELGVPCYKSIVLGIRGDVNQGMGCGLDGKRALLSALTETPYPFPGPATSPAPDGLPLRRLEDLPDLSTGSADGDLMVLEQTLLANGYTPHYADLTRKDLDIPVCRAVVPGLEIVSDFDRFTRLSPRLFRNYLRLFDKP
ncbi:YcaO-like family protein [Paucidesulfovibrio longus]|uniref:YcaO-like family protein n=1 Tax=Paucidesulfovibrio longus TaxID=889 RepID=UPI0003B3D333|nr:YcaO-like family protein [Paucidesulfovibrio longus]